jgi:FkbM family methyltransferase
MMGKLQRWRGRFADARRMAWLTRSPVSFLWRELGRRAGAGAVYRLRDSGVAIVLRHRSADLEVLYEIYVEHAYDPPKEVAAAIERAPIRTVADLGAHVGLFSGWALASFRPQNIVAIEPDPANLERLRACVALNEGGPTAWTVVAAAAATEDGEARLIATGGESSFVAPGGLEGDTARIAVSQVDAFPLIADADLVKIDVEGAEWPLLADPRLAELAARLVVVEHHPRYCPSASAREACVERLERADYRTVLGPYWGSGCGIVWGIRR